VTPRRPDLTGRQPNAVLSALSVLEEVARVGPGVTAQQISANLGLPRATAYRLLNLLVQDEYLVRMPDLSGFALGRKVALLAGLSARQESDRAIEAILAKLRARIRGGVHLADLRQGSVRFLDVDEDFPLSDPARIAADPGVSALGRLLLAEQACPAGAAPEPYAVQVGALIPGFGCFAVPIRDPAGRLVAAVALALPAPRLAAPAHLVGLVSDDVPRLAAALEARP
jgi:DNA-binding IclR family transcriptional regulator